jgi:hypothetical protein
MNSVKQFGQRSGRFKAVEDNMIVKLMEYESVHVYPSTRRFCIGDLLTRLEEELRAELGFEEITITARKFDTHFYSWTIEPELIGYKIFIK